MTEPTEIIGFDLGHAETVITKTARQGSVEPKVVEVNNRKVVVTAVCEHPEHGVMVGDDAYQNSNPEKLRVLFKSPHLTDPEARRPLKLFVQKIVEILSQGKRITGGMNSLFVVGCPSGWATATRKDYEMLLRESGLQHVAIVAESHAAFLAARDSREVSADALKKSVLIIDIGSSTTDFTAVSRMKEKPINFGSNEIGAGIIDKIIFKRWLNAQKTSKEISEFLKIYPQYKSVCLIYARKVKQEYFNSNNTSTAPADIYKKIRSDDGQFLFDVELYDRDMEEVLSTPIREFLKQSDSELSGLNWKEAFRKILRDAREKVADDLPRTILLTGGASRMSFVREYCEEVFPEANVTVGSEPEFTIAKGLAWQGRQSGKTSTFRRDIADLFESGKLREALRNSPDDNEPSALDVLIFAVAHFITWNLAENIILPAFVEWREGEIATLRQMEGVIRDRTDRFLKDLNKGGAEGFEEAILVPWINEYVKPTVERLVKPVCDRADISSSELTLSEDFYVNLPHVKMTASPDVSGSALEGVDFMGSLAAVVGSVVFATLFGGAGVALIAGPIGWIIGLVIGLVLMFGGKELMMEEVKDYNVWGFVRKMGSLEKVQEKVRKMIPSDETDQTEDEEDEEENPLATFEGIYEALQEKADTFDELLMGIEEKVEEEMVKKAEDAEMLIK